MKCTRNMLLSLVPPMVGREDLYHHQRALNWGVYYRCSEVRRECREKDVPVNIILKMGQKRTCDLKCFFQDYYLKQCFQTQRLRSHIHQSDTKPEMCSGHHFTFLLTL